MYENIIIIPFRNRDEHLEYYIKNAVPLIQEYLPNSKVVVVEQNEGKLFNRGALLNVAFKEYKNNTKYFFTHDVDVIPNSEIVKSIYTKEDINMFRIKCPHNTSLGCIIKVDHDTIFNINGFPNYIWGWGIEDRALYYRCLIKNINITDNKNKKMFKMLKHSSNSIEYTGEKKIISEKWTLKCINKLNNNEKEKMIIESGINNLEYTILEKKMLHDIVEIIKVDI